MGKTILSIDPGGTTGYAYRAADGSILTGTTETGQELWDMIAGKPDVVVFELFSTQGRVDKYMLYTVELVGSIKALCHVLKIHGFAHRPQNRMAWMTDAKTILRAQGRRYVVHEHDALAHLLCHEATGR